MNVRFLLIITVVTLNIRLTTLNCLAQGIGINTSGNPADSSAILDVNFNNKGMLIPRLTTTERNAISNPANSLLIFNTTIQCFQAYYAAGAIWVSISCIDNQLPGSLPDSAGYISGSNFICCPLNGISYFVPPIQNATGYVWLYSGTGVTISSFTNPVLLNFSASATSGVLTVMGTNTAGFGPVSASYAITVNHLPAAPESGIHIPSDGQIIWNWSAVSGAVGYKYNTNNNYNTAIDNGASISCTQTGLLCNNSYSLYVWAYNLCGHSAATILSQSTTASCCSPLVDSRDGQNYNIVKIGSQCWMAQNLNYGTFVPISVGGQDPPGIQKYCQSQFDVDNSACLFGGLYEWAEMLNGSSGCNGTGVPPDDNCSIPVQGICPVGWHIPSHYEWTTLEKNAGSDPAAFPYDTTTNNLYLGVDEGGNLKEAGLTHWVDPNLGATNSSGFSAIPGSMGSWNGQFILGGYGRSGYWWSSTDSGTYSAWLRSMNYDKAKVIRSKMSKTYALSVRCVKN
ncbi:MAG TPA: hypothetical protein DEH02_09710 [Bacteroidales bacterium]|nr:MAG: hypothetical protein A2X01_11190 [Bacteroidetes bacterium GWF2_35_48]HBX51327.1 hypothetical protein [Bacteroidales bacterium]